MPIITIRELKAKPAKKYDEALQGVVLAVGKVRQSSPGSASQALNVVLGDKTGVITATLHCAKFFDSMKPNAPVILKNFVSHISSLSVTSETTIFHTGLYDVGEEVRKLGAQLKQNLDSTAFQVRTFVFLDLEATGLQCEKPKITEVSLVAVHRTNLLHSLADGPPRVLNKLTIPVYPMKPMLPVVTDITGLDNMNLFHQQQFDSDLVDLMTGFFRRLDSPVCLLAHNGNGYDFPLLQAEIKQAGRDMSMNIHCADTLEAFRALDKLESVPTLRSLSSLSSSSTSTRVRSTSVGNGGSAEADTTPPGVHVTPESSMQNSAYTGQKREPGGNGVSAGGNASQLQHVRRRLFTDSPKADKREVEGDSAKEEVLAVSLNASPTPAAKSLSETGKNIVSGVNNKVGGTSGGDSADKSEQKSEDLKQTHKKTGNEEGKDDVNLYSSETIPLDLSPGGQPITNNNGNGKRKMEVSPAIPSSSQISKTGPSSNSGEPPAKKRYSSYKLAEIYRQEFGHPPNVSHSAEDDCMTLLAIAQKRGEELCCWVDEHAVSLCTHPCMYTPRAVKKIPPGVFPYQL